ncbi:hypothetical protein DOM22_01185 [Bdellovibrio sp. ZAP7]|uniref:DUF4365 domain-containing protein n=1 Tax=Bdellovibrio sp. ZAP7 TaxID=2231053 RepID=UPI00115BCB23|nr:DUF4365 domain-containing protein [Bdellovibrio sp. ZAP7]QDK43872.1 hypothetical protein DOM22_01185 [Bdellovibrio sp. ZAP7]
MAMTETQIQENLSVAYCHAVISHAGYGVATARNDHGIDMWINCVTEYNGKRHDGGILLALQLKATKNAKVIANHVHYKIDMDDLRRLKRKCAQPKFLVVYIMPRTTTNWVSSSHTDLRMQHGAYYISADNLPAPTAAGSVVIRIPQTNLFDANAVHTLAGPMAALLEEDDVV